MAMAIQATSPDYPHCPDVDPTGGWTVEPRFYQTLPGVVAGDVVRVKCMARLAPGSPLPTGSSIGSFALTVDSEGNLHYPPTNNTIGGSSLSANWSEVQGSVTVPPIPSGHVFALGFSGHTFGGGNGVIEFDNMALVVAGSGALLNAKAWLDGAYVPGTNLMRDDLRVAGLIPLTPPLMDGTVGGPMLPGVLDISGPNAIVDWIRLELRFGRPDQGPETLVRRAALIQRDGDIVDVDGVSPVSLPLKAGNCHVVVRHRNHLGAMSASPLSLSTTPVVFDLRLATTPLFIRGAPYADQARRTVGTTRTLWAGDATSYNVLYNKQVLYTGQNNDRDVILGLIGGTTPTATLSGYHFQDINLDGVVKYTGPKNDRDLILLSIGGSAPTAVRHEQVPN